MLCKIYPPTPVFPPSTPHSPPTRPPPTHHIPSGFQAIHLACKHGHSDVVACLIARGVALDDASNEPGLTPVELAEQGGHPDIAVLCQQAPALDGAAFVAAFADASTSDALVAALDAMAEFAALRGGAMALPTSVKDLRAMATTKRGAVGPEVWSRAVAQAFGRCFKILKS